MASEPAATKPVHRIACFRFKQDTSTEQIAGRTKAFLDLYAERPELLVTPPKGGKPLDTPLDLTNVKRDKVCDTGFIVVFKSDEARKEFDSGPGHSRVKDETDSLLEQVFVYDFVEQANLGY